MYIDAARQLDCLGRYVNDPHGSGTLPNLAFDKQPARARAALVCLRPIDEGDELLADYGGQFWRGHAFVSSTDTPEPTISKSINAANNNKGLDDPKLVEHANQSEIRVRN